MTFPDKDKVNLEICWNYYSRKDKKNILRERFKRSLLSSSHILVKVKIRLVSPLSKDTLRDFPSLFMCQG